MKCIIVDDEPLAREGLELKVQRVPFLQLEGLFANATDAFNYLHQNDIDLIFLDIQMPDLTGLDLLRSIKNPPQVIFTTAYSEYALEGFELDATDYLLKPISLNRFLKAVNKAKDLHDLKTQQPTSIEAIQEDYVYIKADRQYNKVFFKDIIYIEGMRNYVIIHTLHERILPAINLKNIFQQLPPTTFARINKSYVINVDFIEKVLTDFVLIHGKELPLGKLYKEAFINTHVKNKLLNK